MTGFWVALSLVKSVAEIRAVLEQWFPALAVEPWDLSSSERAKVALESPAIASADVLFQVYYNRSEFPTVVQIDKFPGPHDDTVTGPTMLEVARLFAAAFACRAFTDDSGYGGDASPYWAIMWDEGRSFLADLCDSEFLDETGGLVQIVREIPLPPFELDESGRPVG